MGPIIRIKEAWGGRKAHLEMWIKVVTIRGDMSHMGMLLEGKEPIWFITKSEPDHRLKMMTKLPNRWNNGTRN